MIAPRERYKDMTMKQKVGTLKILDRFFNRHQFGIIIEIGTVPGALSNYLLDKAVDMKAEFHTFDVRLPEPRILKLLGNSFHKESSLESELIFELLANNNHVCILNDGEKIATFRRLAGMMKPNDFMLTHDYYKGATEHEDGRIILDEVQSDICKHNLEICLESMFDPILWLCCRKGKK